MYERNASKMNNQFDVNLLKCSFCFICEAFCSEIKPSHSNMFRLIVIYLLRTLMLYLCGLKSKATTNGSSVLVELLLFANSDSGRLTWHSVNLYMPIFFKRSACYSYVLFFRLGEYRRIS